MNALFSFLFQVAPGPEIDPNVAGAGLIQAISQSHWGLVIGFGVMLTVWVLRVFVFPAINTKLLPYVAILIATAGSFAVVLVEDPANWLNAIFAGIQAGLVAAGAWGLLPGAAKDATKAATYAKSQQRLIRKRKSM